MAFACWLLILSGDFNVKTDEITLTRSGFSSVAWIFSEYESTVSLSKIFAVEMIPL